MFFSRLALVSAVVWMVASPALAQMQNLKIDPALMQQMMQAMQNQQINIKQYRDSGRTNCDEKRFVACEAGYRCTSAGYDGKQSTSNIQGMKFGKCHITTLNHDGSTGDCHFTRMMLKDMMAMYQRDTITIGEATAMGNRVMNECSFKDVAGNPVTMNIPTLAQQGAAQ